MNQLAFAGVGIGDGSISIELLTSTAPVPEPGTWLLMVTGLVGLLGYGWRRRNA
jgi:hypothetical protein